MSTSATARALRKTSLNTGVHRQLGAKMVDFGGWDMPACIAPVSSPNTCLSATGVGLFDVSHMGDIQLRGPEVARPHPAHLHERRPQAAGLSQAQYSAMLYPQGTFVDDVIVHKLSDNDYLIVINAGTREKDFSWVKNKRSEIPLPCHATTATTTPAARHSGPQGRRDVAKLTNVDLATIKSYWFKWEAVCGPAQHRSSPAPDTPEKTVASRIYVPSDEATSKRVWEEVLEAGKGIRYRSLRPGRAQHPAA